MDHKSGYLVILCCALIHMTTLGSDMIFYHTADQDATTIYLVSLVIAYLLYPLLGWMADVYFTRYSFVRASFISTIAAMGLLIVSGVLFLTSPEQLYFLLSFKKISLDHVYMNSCNYRYLIGCCSATENQQREAAHTTILLVDHQLPQVATPVVPVDECAKLF